MPRHTKLHLTAVARLATSLWLTIAGCSGDDGGGGPMGAPDAQTGCASVAPVAGMRCIEEGAFTDSGSGPNTTHDIARFLLDEREVTVAAYEACVTAGVCPPETPPGTCNRGVVGREQHPVNCMDWFQADTYCRWAGKRLPTEWEWEWAARGREAARLYPWGDAVPATQLCWFETNSETTCPVGTYSPAGDTADGIADMAGNVWEWTDSWYDGPNLNRTLRGGSWSSQPQSAGTFHTTWRIAGPPSRRFDTYGFRCAKDAS